MLALRPSNFSTNIIQIVLTRSLKNKPEKMKQVYKEIMKYVDPYAKIRIDSDILLKVRAADVHRYPNADVLVGELHGAHSKNCNIEMSIKVSEDDKTIDVKVGKIGNEDEFHCVLSVPVKAALNIEGKNAVYVEQMLGEELLIDATNNIKTRDIRCETISLKSSKGKIICAGMLLGQKTNLETKQDNCVILDKLQGDEFSCKTEAGSITSSCCYVENSTFETGSGALDLKNVHKRARVLVTEPAGTLHMTGVHGNLHVESKGSFLNLQLSELHGDNLIVAHNAEKTTINISEGIEQATELNVTAHHINLDESLKHFMPQISEQQQILQHTPNQSNSSKLTIRSTNGYVQLGKLSWAEMMSKSFEKKANA